MRPRGSRRSGLGLKLSDLNAKGRGKGAKGPVYRGGHSYQHPINKTLVWNAKGKKPGWLTALEAEGKSALEVG